MSFRQDEILYQYVRPVKRGPGLLLTAVLFMVLIGYAGFAGMLIAFLPPELWFFPWIPVPIALGLILWALPDQNRVPKLVSVGLLSFFIASNYVWPTYVALNLPGLPWMNPQRLALFLFLMVSLYGYAISSEMRRSTLEVVRSDRLIWAGFAGFWLCSLLVLPFSGEYFVFSFNKWINNQIYWSFLFFIAAYLLRKEGGMTMLVRWMIVAAIITALISIPEYMWRRVPWIGYVPNILIGDPLIYEKVGSDQARLDLDQYRARSSFTVSLTFAEFLSMCLPFVLHAAVETKGFLRKVWLGAAILLIAIAMAILTNARSGMNGLIIGLFGYAAIWSFRRWQTKKDDLLAPATIIAFPAAIVAFSVLVVAWQRLRVMVLGGGAQQFSNDAREVQWSLAIDRLLSNPVGHGPGRTAEVLGYTNRGGEVTVDSYYINLLLDYGVIGFIFFFLLAIATGIAALKLYLTSDDPELRLAGPAAISILAFMVIKSVLSQSENMPIFFMLCGAVCALIWRSRSKAAAGTTGQRLQGYTLREATARAG